MLKVVSLLLFFFGQCFGRPVTTLLISDANNYLTLNLLRQLYSESENVFYSPFSISSAFAMLFVGAEGETKNELQQVLGYNFANMTRDEVNDQFERILQQIEDFDSRNYQLSIADKLVAQNGTHINEDYREMLQTFFKTSIETADFQNNAASVTDSINNWVREKTKDKIKKLLDKPLDPVTKLVLLNAVYFKGSWQIQFDPNNTKQELFYNNEIHAQQTDMMKSNGKFNYTQVEELESQLLELPYNGDDISMYILLPNQKTGAQRLTEKLVNFGIVENAISTLREISVDVAIPKFKVESSYSLKDHLKQLGLRQAFSDDADFSGINGKRDLKVSDVFHKAVIEINEEGSEAAAATAIIIGVKTTSINHDMKPIFRADHPFIFFIRDNRNGIILFAGQINKI